MSDIIRDTVTIDAMFNGPNVSANGGYAGGVVSDYLPQGVPHQMRLHAPPPLDTEFTIVETALGINLMDGDKLLVSGTVGEIDPDVPDCPSQDQVAAAHGSPIKNSFDFLRLCYVCGPDRKDHGLHIHPGPIAGNDDQVACFWQTHDEHGDADGNVDNRRLWAGLDCPGYFASAAGKPALLGQMTAHVVGAAKAGEKLIVHAWLKDVSGRKHRAGVALYTLDGTLVAHADQLWVVVNDAMFESLRG